MAMEQIAAAMHEQLPIMWDHAENATVWDNWGQKYIDFTSGIFVANVGHSNPRVIAALKKQLDQRLIHTYTFPSASRQRLSKRLTEFTGYEKVALFSTGSEAVEAALRIAEWNSPRETVVISWRGSMHGKTIGAQCLSGHRVGAANVVVPWPEPHQRWSPPYRFGSVRACVLESYHGWGALFYPKQYVQDVAAWCKDNGALLIFDEVQAGFGRTGKLFAFEHYDVEPDLVICGKGLGGGLPISCVLGSAELLDSDPSLTSTHSGNPLCCAAALATIDEIEERRLIERAFVFGAGLGARLMGRLSLPVHGYGMVWAIWMSDNPRYDQAAIDKANAVVDLAAERGLLLLKTHCGTIKIGPPLTIPEADLREGLDILEGCLRDTL